MFYSELVRLAISQIGGVIRNVKTKTIRGLLGKSKITAGGQKALPEKNNKSRLQVNKTGFVVFVSFPCQKANTSLRGLVTPLGFKPRTFRTGI